MGASGLSLVDPPPLGGQNWSGATSIIGESKFVVLCAILHAMGKSGGAEGVHLCGPLGVAQTHLSLKSCPAYPQRRLNRLALNILLSSSKVSALIARGLPHKRNPTWVRARTFTQSPYKVCDEGTFDTLCFRN